MIRTLSAVFLSLLLSALPACAGDVGEARALARRIMGGRASSIVFKLGKDPAEAFTLESRADKVVITGNSAGSMARGLGYYLSRYCLADVSWYVDDPVELPAVLPSVPGRVRVEARMPMRFFLNYCTYGYSLCWWDWRQWERLIDWMALNGVNMPLAQTGQETVWYNVWRRLGLTDGEVRGFFTGPAYLGWHRMCNIDAFMGPLPREWMDRQLALGQRILARERALSMRPVLSAFAGHVPRALLRHYPGLQTTEVSDWGGFAQPEQYRCTFLHSTDSMYARIQRLFIAEQTRLMGTDHLYGLDPFNEVDPPSLREDSLAMLSAGMYRSLASADKDAVWLQMGWTYKYKTYWTKERQRAVFRAVPQDRLVMLDYWAENIEMWPRCESYFGQPFLWCYLNNFGGRNRLQAFPRRVYDRIEHASEQAGPGLWGVGGTLEALDVNQFPYRLMLDRAWRGTDTYEDYIHRLADQRMGRADAAARRAYADYCERVLEVPRAHRWTMQAERPTMDVRSRELPNPVREAETDVWRQLLALTSGRDAYLMDVVNVGRQCLEDLHHVLWRQFVTAYEVYDVRAMERIGAEIKQVIRDEASLTACHPVFSMRRWIDDARSWGDTPEQKDYYERNARRLLTTWNNRPSSLNDYAGRPWDGLLLTYYLPRWSLFIDRATEARRAGRDFDEQAFVSECWQLETDFCELATPMQYPEAQDALPLARRLYDKYFGGNEK